ncbi:LysR substrate-binding domain-containing protein [Comamonas aquatica]|uniref:LysR substrate-binding domain-containing protein n=1 Tax=Comamonas aquatica TaxID=225991 RepID=UPI0036F2667E
MWRALRRARARDSGSRGSRHGRSAKQHQRTAGRAADRGGPGPDRCPDCAAGGGLSHTLPRHHSGCVRGPAARARRQPLHLGFLQVPEGFDAHIVARTLSTSEAILCAAPSYIARHGEPRTLQELAQHLCVLRRPASLHRDSLALWRSQQSTTVPPEHDIEVTAAITINQTASILQMVLDGAGIATFTLDAAGPFLAQGLLQQVLPGWITGRVSVLAALPSRKHLPLRTQAFLDFVFEAHRAGKIDRC